MSDWTIRFQAGTTSGQGTPVSPANPLPVTGSFTATNPSVGTNGAAIPGSSTLFGWDDGSGNLQPVSAANPLPITGSISATTTGHATAAAPSYGEGTDDDLSMNLSGDLRTLAKQSGVWTVGLSAAQTVAVTNAGTFAVQAVQSGTWTVGLSAAQTVGVTNFPTSVDVNSGNLSNSTLRMAVATNQLAIALWGHGATGAAVPANAVYLGASVAGTLTGLVATANGLKTDGSAVTQPVSLTSKTIKTAPISAITVDTDIVAAVTSKRIKVIAYALFTTGTSASTLAFKSNGAGGTLLANVMLQSQANAIFGANLAISAPSFLFATAAGEKLTLDVGNTDPITGFITYFDDDAT